MTRINPTLKLSSSIAADYVVIGVTEVDGSPTLVGATTELAKPFEKRMSVALSAAAISATSKLESVVLGPDFGTRIVAVGLGEADVSPEQVRRSVGAALRTIGALPGLNSAHVAISLELADPELIKAALEGAVLGSYQIERISLESSDPVINTITLVSAASKGVARTAISEAEITTSAVIQARDWINTPPNLLYPDSFATSANQWLRDVRVGVEVLDEKALEKGGFGAILAVGGGSQRKPRLVRMSYAPRGATAHLALVGKGITFDSGGLDIKPAGQMADMKSDMSGAAAVIAAVHAIAALGLKVRVTGYAAMAENLPSGSAYRSSDVLTAFDGQTIENVNTDAEGRLVMADAIARAGLDKPDLIVDVATLTGACVVALGKRIGGLMASDDETADQLLDAAEAAGEEFWQLPITDQIREQLSSQIADMRSGGKNRWGGALTAGAFLQRFVPEATRWAHLDIAGPAFNDEVAYGYTPQGGTGVGVRTLVELARHLS